MTTTWSQLEERVRLLSHNDLAAKLLGVLEVLFRGEGDELWLGGPWDDKLDDVVSEVEDLID